MEEDRIDITIKDKEGVEHKCWIDYKEWQLNRDWLEWAERYMKSDRNNLPYEHQFEQWRKRIYGR